MTASSAVTPGTNAIYTQYNDLRSDLLLGTGIYGTDTDGATITFTLTDVTKGNIRVVTLGGNRVLAVAGAVVGQRFVLCIKQGAGGNTVTWFSGISWPGNVVPTLSTGAGKYDVFGFICIASNTYLGFICGLNI